MVDRRQVALVGWVVLVLAGCCFAEGEFFPTAGRRAAFLRALERRDRGYDPAERMLRASFSSPGYHTTLTSGTVHRTRESLEYAVALLDSGEADRLERACAILERVIGLQDQDPSSRTYGIWPWFLEEPLEKMSPPDWNWADFCGTQLLQVAIDHMDRLPTELRQQVRESILHAAASIRKRNVGPGYTNIALMGTYVTLVAGERFEVRELFDYGRQRLRRFVDYTQDKGSFSEYNSPTYTLVAIEEISRMRGHVRDAELRRLLDELNTFAWEHMARRFHAPTKQWAGPHSRCYSTLLRSSALAAIQRATDDEKIRFVPEEQAWESLDAHRVTLECPREMYPYFKKLDETREEVEAFVRNPAGRHSIVGTTYLHRDFTLGTINIGDLWNQRRPLLAYWNAAGGPAALRLRCLHDGYDYSSASIFCLQEGADVLGAVLFATDRGDTHISLDRIRNATIRARDLRVRLQFEGALDDLELPEKLGLGEPMRFVSGKIAGVFCVHEAEFDDLTVSFETGRDDEAAWIDLVLYPGPGREFDFNTIDEAAIVFTLSLGKQTAYTTVRKPNVKKAIAFAPTGVTQRTTTRQKWTWQRNNNTNLILTIPTTPLPTKQQSAATAAQINTKTPWDATNL